MKRLVLVILVLVGIASGASAAISRDPDFTLLWNRFSSVVVVDSFAIVTGRSGVIVLKYDSHATSYQQVSTTFLDSEPFKQKRLGSVLAVQTKASIIYFYNISALPTLQLLGRVDPGVSFLDFAVKGDNLYLAAEFKGLWRYTLTGYQSLTFADSSMLGIHYTRLVVQDSTLYALDDYNGILRYRLASDGDFTFRDYLYIPFQVREFATVDTRLAITLDAPTLWLASATSGTFAIQDSVSLLATPDRLMVADTTILILNDSLELGEIVDSRNLTTFSWILQGKPDGGLDGSIFTRGSEQFLAIPGATGGLLVYDLGNLSNNAAPRQSLKRPGPITSLAIHNHRLLTGGLANPLDFYKLGNDGEPTFDTTYLSGLNNMTTLAQTGDTSLVVYQQMERLFLIEATRDSIFYDGAVSFGHDTITGVYFPDQKIDTLRPLFLFGETSVAVYAVTDSGLVLSAGSIEVLGRIRDMALVDSVLCIATNKGVWLYRIYNDFWVSYRTDILLKDQCTRLQRLGNRILAFNANLMVVINITNPMDPQVDTTIELPVDVDASAIDGEHMYTVGSGGMGSFDLTGPYPRLTDWGGRAGTLIAAEDGIVAVSDSTAIYIFDVEGAATGFADHPVAIPQEFTLSQNYPNPFNPSTTIQYELPNRSRVEMAVFNLLGQRVTTLVDDDQAPGIHTVVWDGADKTGRQVASGIYFYRVIAGGASQTRKMILLK